MKIRSVGAELFHADGQTDMTKLIVALRNFVKAPKTRVLPRRVFMFRVVHTVNSHYFPQHHLHIRLLEGDTVFSAR